MKKEEIKILIAGVGNELRQDDAFGVLLAQRLQKQNFPSSVKIIEVGSGGIHLVQQLFDRYQVLVLLDIVRWGDAPGSVYFRSVDVKDLTLLPKDEQKDFLADMHYINPLKALMMAKALHILPGEVYFLGCESENSEDIGIGLSETVSAALPAACDKVTSWINAKISSVNV